MGQLQRISRPALSRWKVLLVVIIGMLLLAGCGTAESEVTFYEGERWQCVERLAVPADLLEMEGGEEALEREVLSNLEEYAPGVEISWHKEYEGRDVVYYFTLDGTDWETLNRFVFDSNASIIREDNKVHVRYPIPWGAELVYSSLTLKGNRIISSNADETTDGSAIWYNPTGTIEAVLVEKAQTNWLETLCFVLAFVVVGVMIFRSLRRLEPARRQHQRL